MKAPSQLLAVSLPHLFGDPEGSLTALLIAFLLMICVSLVAFYRKKQRDKHFKEAHYDRLKEYWPAFEDPDARATMAETFQSRYAFSGTGRQRNPPNEPLLPEVWATLQAAVDADKERLLQSNEAFAQAVAFAGESLFPGRAKTWRAGPISVYLDISLEAGSGPDNQPLSVDLGLIVGEGFWRGEFCSDAEIYNELTNELGIAQP